ncbi:MAG TPA: DUF222 domain-containing protein, partial [Actinomycetes bacterium]|nr:DUF222 domain-containing protein [Actinomycetes bacterium]
MPNSIEVLTDRVAAIGDSIDELLLTVASLDGPGSEMDPRARTDDRLRELVVGLQRVCNAAEAAQADALVAMGEEARQLDAAEFAATGLPVRSHEEFLPDEVSVLLACTKPAAGRRYALAHRAISLPALHSAWSDGLLDARKAQVIADEVGALSDPEMTGSLPAAEVAALTEQLTCAGVEYAQRHTWSETRAWLRRRVLKVAPEVAELRRGRAEQERKVTITPSDDGMSELWAWLPSVEARQIQQALTAAAHDLGAGDARTMDQRRADLLVAWLLGPDHAPTVHLHLIAEPNASTGIPGDAGAWLPGVGTLTELQTSDLLGSARTVVVANPGDLPAEHSYRPSPALDSAIRARDVTCRFPGCRRSTLGTGTGTDLDHTVPWP